MVRRALYVSRTVTICMQQKKCNGIVLYHKQKYNLALVPHIISCHDLDKTPPQRKKQRFFHAISFITAICPENVLYVLSFLLFTLTCLFWIFGFGWTSLLACSVAVAAAPRYQYMHYGIDFCFYDNTFVKAFVALKTKVWTMMCRDTINYSTQKITCCTTLSPRVVYSSVPTWTSMRSNIRWRQRFVWLLFWTSRSLIFFFFGE